MIGQLRFQGRLVKVDDLPDAFTRAISRASLVGTDGQKSALKREIRTLCLLVLKDRVADGESGPEILERIDELETALDQGDVDGVPRLGPYRQAPRKLHRNRRIPMRY